MCKQGRNQQNLSDANAQRFAEELASMELSINEIARRMGGQPPQRIRDVLRGKTRLPTDMLALAISLGIDVNYIVTGVRILSLKSKAEYLVIGNLCSGSKKIKNNIRSD